jgi:hypothetical protein
MKHGRRNEIANSQKSKVPANKPNPLHFFTMAQCTEKKMFLFQKQTLDMNQEILSKDFF